MAHVSAQAERSGCARSATRLRWQKVSTGAGVEYECVVRTSANVPRPESHRVPDGMVRHTRVRQAAVAMRARSGCGTPPARRPRRTAVSATSRHGRTTSSRQTAAWNRRPCPSRPPCPHRRPSQIRAGAGGVAPIEALGVRKAEEGKITPHYGTFTRAYITWWAPTVNGDVKGEMCF
jgi:hypothetical protein